MLQSLSYVSTEVADSTMTISYKVIHNDSNAKITTAAALIKELSKAGRQGKLSQALKAYTMPGVLVIDEVGYLTYGPDAANVLYHVVNDRYLRKRPMLFTTNKTLRDWGRVLHDDDLARAIADRALERGRLISLDGPSQRTRHLDIDPFEDPELQPARVSGRNSAEFPEPTHAPSRGDRRDGSCSRSTRRRTLLAVSGANTPSASRIRRRRPGS